MSDVLEKLQYIMDSPPQEHGGFHPGTVKIATEAHREITRLRGLLREACECIPDTADGWAENWIKRAEAALEGKP